MWKVEDIWEGQMSWKKEVFIGWLRRYLGNWMLDVSIVTFIVNPIDDILRWELYHHTKRNERQTEEEIKPKVQIIEEWTKSKELHWSRWRLAFTFTEHTKQENWK
jgi:ABC-type siderophore export system fused ATPase/permease subunit